MHLRILPINFEKNILVKYLIYLEISTKLIFILRLFARLVLTPCMHNAKKKEKKFRT